jgi:RNA polymerase subunit RPABC4/transcription elongation factor Spt4
VSSEVICAFCGHINPAEANFCSSCGASLHTDEPNDSTVTLHADHHDHASNVRADGTPMPGVLVLRRGIDSTESFPLAATRSVVGRNPDSTIFLDDVTVSRKHSEIEAAENGGYSIRDCGSLNGTYVNRERISEQLLHTGDEVQIGKFRLIFLSAVDRRRHEN